MRIFSVLITLVLITGCFASLRGEFFAAGGDRSAGTVELVCSYNSWTGCNFNPNPVEAMRASEVCENWGYSDGAKPFGGYINQPGLHGTGQIKVAYQCLGDLEK